MAPSEHDIPEAAVGETAAPADAEITDAEVVEPDPEAEEHAAAEAVQGDLDELHRKAAERDEYLALAQRTQADFENYRKRMARDVAAAQDRGIGRIVKELLPALDNLDLALQNADADGGHFVDGVRLVQRELVAALARVGVEPFDPTGELFDPEHHEAMVQHPVEGVEAGLVATVYQPGYRLNDTVLRPARVVVAQ